MVVLPEETAVILPPLTVATRELLLLQDTLAPEGAPYALIVRLSPSNMLIWLSLRDRV